MSRTAINTSGVGIQTPLSPSTLSQTATLVRTVEADGSGGYTITPSGENPITFKCALLPPSTFSAPASDISPRQWKNKFELVYLAKILGVPQTVWAPGTRVEIEEVEYEVVSDSLDKRLGPVTFAYSTKLLPVSQLYPLTARLTDLKGVDVPDVDPIPFAVWESTSDRYASRGRFDDTEGEVPVDFMEAVKGTNLTLLIGTRKYKITTAHTHFAQPHISLRLVSLDV
jgi:hypothetical protein